RPHPRYYRPGVARPALRPVVLCALIEPGACSTLVALSDEVVTAAAVIGELGIFADDEHASVYPCLHMHPHVVMLERGEESGRVAEIVSIGVHVSRCLAPITLPVCPRPGCPCPEQAGGYGAFQRGDALRADRGKCPPGAGQHGRLAGT